MRCGAAIAALVLLAAAPAGAQIEDDEPLVAPESGAASDDGEVAEGPAAGQRIAQRYAKRTITMPARTLRLSAFFSGHRRESATAEDFVFAFQIGGGYGITDDLEIGIGTEKIGPSAIAAGRAGASGWRPTGEGLLSFVVADGDLDFGDIPIYGRYRFLSTDLVEIGAELAVLVPTGDGSAFGLRFGAPVRIHAGEIFALDTGLYASMVFGDDPAGPADDDFWGGLWIPVRPVINVADWLGLALTTGVHVGPFDGNYFAIPLGLEAVASFPMGTASMLDLVAGFEWPAFLRPSTDDNDKAEVGTYVLSAGARLYLGL